LVAAVTLGGPAAAAWVGLLGSTQARELRREVPWYGVVANHCGIMAPAIIAAFVLQAIPGREYPVIDFFATVASALLLSFLNVLITCVCVSIRDGEPVTKLMRADLSAYLSMLTLAPIAWLMARMYVTAGWWAVLLFAMPMYTTRIAFTRLVEVREMFTETVSSLAEAVDKRDKFTSGHSRKVQQIAVDIGKAMKCSDDELEALEWGGLLHDIGKIGVPDSVLKKQDRLTREERVIMNSHPKLGADIIAPVKRLAPEIPIILHHHEWFNGSGYPDRLVGDNIPKLARILHVADAFEAMTAARPYRMTPLTYAQALAELRKFGGIQFDPAVVDAFVKTKWAAGLSDPGRPGMREVPLIGQAAGGLSGGGVPAGGMAMVGTSSGGSVIEAADSSAASAKGSLTVEPA
jgi:putative nucleotidyltransferase with HDIG domain